jgi:tetratricopeptide (TPR) repeat protein
VTAYSKELPVAFSVAACYNYRMDESWKALLLKRFLPAAFFMGIGFTGMMMSGAGESMAGVAAIALIGIAFLIIGACFIAGPIAYMIVSPIVGLLYPEDHSYSPPPLYRLPEMYIRQGRYQEASLEYQKILHHHPRELRAYLALLEVSFQHLQDPLLAGKIYKAGLRRLKDPGARAQLEETFQTLQAGAPLATSSIESYP